jgi:hypothetical protein
MSTKTNSSGKRLVRSLEFPRMIHTDDVVVHEFQELMTSTHRLKVNGICGEWAKYDQVAVNGIYHAVIPEAHGDIPEVFIMQPVVFTRYLVD